MPNRTRRANFLALATWSLMLTLVVFLCVRFLDIPLALFVKHNLYANAGWSQVTSDLPDLLLLAVTCSTFVSLVLHRVRSRRGLTDALTRLAQLVAWVGPVALLVKIVLKFVFGRVNTRMWLQEPGLYGFHWCQRLQGCDGFPSGHMLVIVALMAALWRYYPKWRFCCLALGLLLGTALIATNYHFLSDVLAGAFLGVVVEVAVFAQLTRGSRSPVASIP